MATHDIKLKKYVAGVGWEDAYPETTVTQIIAAGTPSITTYLRGDGTWSTIDEGGASVTVSSTPPASSSQGDLWFEDTTGSLYIYYDDGVSAQWIEISSAEFMGVAQDFIDHIANISNPHQVTATQVGAYTTSETDTAIANAIAAIIDTSPETLNTLNELAAAINDDPLFFQTIQNSINGKADLNHTHTVADVIGLQGALDGKEPANANIQTHISDTTIHFTQANISITESQISDLQNYLTDYTVTQADVTAHQAALSITESQISDLGSYEPANANIQTHIGTTTGNPHNVTKSDVGLGNVTNEAQIPLTQKGTALGVAELDANGLVLSSQLPSFVDDVLEYANLAGFPATGESGKIYIAQDTNLTYRWSGSAYTEISASLALGETSATAYRGDRGKTAYDHSQVTTGNPHSVTAADVGAEPAFTKNTGFNKDFGSTAGTVVEGDDARLSDSRTPTAHTHAISDVTDLQTALDVKVTKYTLTGRNKRYRLFSVSNNQSTQKILHAKIVSSNNYSANTRRDLTFMFYAYATGHSVDSYYLGEYNQYPVYFELYEDTNLGLLNGYIVMSNYTDTATLIIEHLNAITLELTEVANPIGDLDYSSVASEKAIYHEGNFTPATVATSGDYDDLTNKPSIPDGNDYVAKAGDTMTGDLNVKGDGSGRARILLVSTANQPNDLLFGANNVEHWSITSRDAGDPFLGLYNTVGAPGWAWQISNSTNVMNFTATPTVNSTAVSLVGHTHSDYLAKAGDTMTGVLTLNREIRHYDASGVRYMNTDPRWSGDTGRLHIWATTGAGAEYGAAGINLYDGDSYHSIDAIGNRIQINEFSSAKATLGTRTNTTAYGGNEGGLTINSVAELRSPSTGAAPALTFHYEGLATRHLIMESDGDINFVSPSSENSGVAIVKVNGNTVWHAGNLNKSLTYTLLGSINLTTGTDTLNISPSNGLNSVVVIEAEVFSQGAPATWTGPLGEIGNSSTYTSSISTDTTRITNYQRNTAGTQIIFTGTTTNNVYRARVYELKVD